jgi:hypothetical protein
MLGRTSSPGSLGDIACLGKVQVRAVTMVTGLEQTDYHGRLRALGMLTLEERRHQSDMHMVYKIMEGHSGLDLATWFELVNSDAHHVTRSTTHHNNIKVKTGRLEIRRNFSVLE